MPWGTPEQVLEKLDFIRETTGMAGFTPSLCYGGMPYEEAERNIACFVDQVMPTLKEWETRAHRPRRRDPRAGTGGVGGRR